MPLVNWNESLSVGVKAMDDQHMILMESLNDLNQAMLVGADKSVTVPLVHRMAKYIADHFAAEEAMMAAVHYPGLDEHRAIHEELTRQVAQHVSRFEHGEVSLNARVLTVFREWLTAHILADDLKYGPWVNSTSAVALAERPGLVCEITPRM
jgi:hemerythrin